MRNDDTPSEEQAAGSSRPAEPEQPAESQQPASTRRTRHRAASRPAGPPAAGSTDSGGDAPAPAALSASSPLFQAPDLSTVAAPSPRTDQQESGGDAPKEESHSSEGSGKRRRSRGGRSRRKSRSDKPQSDKPQSDKPQSDKDGQSSDHGDQASDDHSGSNDSDSGHKPAGSGKAEEKSAEDKKGEKQQSKTEDSGAEKSGSSSSRRRRRRRRSGSSSNGDDHDNGSDGASDISSVDGSTRIEAKRQRRREGRAAGRKRAPILSESEFLARRESVERVMAIRQREQTTQVAVLEDNVLVEHYVALASQTSIIGNVYLGRVQNVLPSMEAAFIDIGKGRNAVLYAGEVNWDLVGDSKPRRIEEALKPGQAVLVQVSKDPVGHKGARLTAQISLPGRYLVYMPGGGNSGISRKLPDTERNRLKTLLKEILPGDAGVIIRTAAEGASEEQLTRDVTRLTARWEDIEKKQKSGQAPKLLYEEPDTTLKVVRDLFTEDFSKLVVSGDDAWDMVDAYVSHVAPDLRDRLERYDVRPTPADSGAAGSDEASEASETSEEGAASEDTAQVSTAEGADSGDSADNPDSASKDDDKPDNEPASQRPDVFSAYRVDEQIAKALERKVWLPSGGSLVIDRTEAMTVVDVNTGKFTGSGGNLEETVTKNNLEAAEEIVRQLRLRDVGGIIVIDFIDMVLESNRDLVLRRLVECLARDRTRHQVAEVTSLGLVQMTRKRISTGLVEAFSHACETCHGRGVVIESEPVEPKPTDQHRGRSRGSRNSKRGSSRRKSKTEDGQKEKEKAAAS